MQLKPLFFAYQRNHHEQADLPLAGALMLGATLLILAGPDFQAIEQGRKADQEAEATHARCRRGRQTGRGDCRPSLLILLLDHGLRA